MMDVPYKAPKPPIEIKLSETSPLEKALSDKKRMNTIRQKYNLKNPKEMKLPNQIYEGEDRS